MGRGRAGNRQPQREGGAGARAASHFLGREEGIEHAVRDRRVDAGAVVLDPDDDVGPATGSRMVKVEPAPGLLSKVSWPPCRSVVIRHAIASP